jgi:anaerobic carbon-monoxide dehydrogenase iron sulfur subunit
VNNCIVADHRSCTGCKTCEVVCSLRHWGVCNPERSAIRVIRREERGLVHSFPVVCRQCADAACVRACPTGALSRNEDRSALTFDGDACTACGLCEETCPVHAIAIARDGEGQRIVFCDLCGGEPECITFCHAGCLALADASGGDTVRSAEELANLLRREGFADWRPARRGN